MRLKHIWEISSSLCGTYTISRLLAIASLVVGLGLGSQSAAQNAWRTDAEALEEASKLARTATGHRERGEYDDALLNAQNALQIRVDTLGPNHPTVARSYLQLAAIYAARESHDRAITLYKRALVINEKSFGPSHVDVARALYGLAEVYRTQGDYRDAKPLYKRALAQGESSLGQASPLVADILNGLGELHKANAAYKEAMRLHRRALEIRRRTLGEHHSAVGQSLNNIGEIYYFGGNFTNALSFFERSLRNRERSLGKSHPQVAASVNNVAIVHHIRGDFERALPLYRRALAIRERAFGPQHTEVAQSLNNIAALQRARGYYEEALPFYERALAIERAILGPDNPKTATVVNNIAVLYAYTGAYDKAMAFHKRALELKKIGLGDKHPEVANSSSNLALIYYFKGDHQQAMALHERAVATYEQALGRDHHSVAVALNNLALMHKEQGSYKTALAMYERAVSIDEKVFGENHASVASTLHNVALLHIAHGYRRQALDTSLRAVAISAKVHGKSHPLYGMYLATLAAMYDAQRDYDRASSAREQALAILEDNLAEHHPHVAAALYDFARHHWIRGNREAAAAHLQRAMAARDEHMRLVGAGDRARAKRLLLTRYAHDIDTSVSFAVANAGPRSGYIGLTTLLAHKGRVLDSTTDALAALRRRSGPEEKRLLDEHRLNRAVYARQLLRGPGRLSRAKHRDSLDALEHRARELEGIIARRGKAIRGYLRKVTPAAVQAALPAGTPLVEWVRYRPFDPGAEYTKQYGAERYAASILHKTGEPAWIDLGEAKVIDVQIAEWRSALSRELITTDTIARRVDELVMAPIRAHLGDVDSVYLAPDGPLNLIPFAALVDETGQYLVDRYLFTYLTSGRDLLRLQDRDDIAEVSPPFIVADPRYDLRGQSTSFGFEPLPHASLEAKAVQSVLSDATLLTGEQATETAIRELKRPVILHIATHGFSTPMTCGASEAEAGEAALQSGLALAGANACNSAEAPGDNPDDGLLTALEVASLDLYGTELAVLSACDTGIGATEIHDAFLDKNIARGDGIHGLRRALVLAGVRTQMVSLWRVDDAATRRLMTSYYRKLADGKGRSEALREVQRAFLRTDGLSHPKYWASFLVLGESAAINRPIAQPSPASLRGPRGCACDIAVRPEFENTLAYWLLAFVLVIFIRRR